MKYTQEDIIQILKLMGHPVRLSIIELLMDTDQMNVGAIVETLDLPQATVSQQLAKLKTGNIVDSQRDGTKVYYRLVNNLAIELTKTIHSNH